MASGHLTAPHSKAGQMAAPTSTASPSINPLPTGSRPQMANLGRNEAPFAASALHLSCDIKIEMSAFSEVVTAQTPLAAV